MLSFKLLGFVFALCSIPLVPAQSNKTLVEIEAIKAHFNQSGLVPSFLSETLLNPTALLAVSFKGLGKIAIGQPISSEQAVYEPNLSLTPANASMPLPSAGKYTVLTVDAGPPGADESHGQRRHWLVNGATIPAANANMSVVGATEVTRWTPPNPPVGDGPHRYVVLVLVQPADFLAPVDLSLPNVGGGVFSVGEYIKYTKITMVAASYFTCQRGPATGVLPSTSAVVSQTLPGWKGATQTTGAVAQKSNSALSTTGSALALFLAPIMGLLAL